MKKVIALVIALTLTLTIAANAQVYWRRAYVLTIDAEEDYFTIVDEEGELWELTECLQWLVGDELLLLIEDNDTEEIHDGIVLMYWQVVKE